MAPAGGAEPVCVRTVVLAGAAGGIGQARPRPWWPEVTGYTDELTLGGTSGGTGDRGVAAHLATTEATWKTSPGMRRGPQRDGS